MLTVATGNKAVAAAVKEAAPAVVAAYPITPQTEIVEQIAEYVSSGELKSQYIPVESEHSAMAACIGASVTGARTFTATSSQGLQYMHENGQLGGGSPPSNCHGHREPRLGSRLEHLGRAYRCHAGERHRMAPGVRGIGPRGVRCRLNGICHRGRRTSSPSRDGEPRRVPPLAYDATV